MEVVLQTARREEADAGAAVAGAVARRHLLWSAVHHHVGLL